MKVSIITASYNYEKYIEETIQSVIRQTYSDWELIIVDDGSTDNSLETIKKFCNIDKRIKLYTHGNNENKGLKQTLLLGISKAQSDWIVFLESDDLLEPSYLEKKVKIAEQYPDVGLIFNDVFLFGDKSRVEFSQKPFKKNHNKLISKTFPRNIFKELNTDNRILTFSTVMVKKSILLSEYFNTPIDKLLDWWLYVHIAYKNNVYYIPEKLTKWRLHKGSYITQKQGARLHFIQLRAYWDIFKKHPNLYRILIIRYIKSKLGLKLRETPLD